MRTRGAVARRAAVADAALEESVIVGAGRGGALGADVPGGAAVHARGTGLGHQLMAEALTLCKQNFPEQKVKISAQEHLEGFYNRHGFERVSDMYLEDNIPHIAMLQKTL